MSRSKLDSLLTLTQSFFLSYLQSTRGASSHTVRAYRDALKLFFLYLAGQKHKSIADLDLDGAPERQHFVGEVQTDRLETGHGAKAGVAQNEGTVRSGHSPHSTGCGATISPLRAKVGAVRCGNGVFAWLHERPVSPSNLEEEIL